MSFFLRLGWTLTSRPERDLLLQNLPEFRQRPLQRVFRNKLRYPKAFDAKQALFIHVPKTAGKSVSEGLLHIRSVGHNPASWYQAVSAKKYARYFKFAFVRNPWDRLVSAYEYLLEEGSATSNKDTEWAEFIKSFGSFDDFVCQWVNERNIYRRTVLTPQFEFLVDNFGGLSVDYLGRFETLEEDYQCLAEKIGGCDPLPHKNASSRKDFRSYYSAQAIDIVARVYAEDIRLFGYDYG